MSIASPSRFRRRFLRSEAGFALVTTLVLMVLLVVVAVGLLQLSAISLRSADQEKWAAQARANARVALKLALGQLQLELGPDRRISANAGILDSNPTSAEADGVTNPYWTGVWTATESPFTKWTLDRPSYDKKSVFRRWLVSGNPDDMRLIDKASSATDSSFCQLVPEGPTGSTKHGVSVPVLKGPGSGFAWWTADNGQKATLRPGQSPDAKSKSEALANLRRSDGNGHAAIDDKLPNRSNGLDKRLVDIGTVDAATTGLKGADRASWKYLHDLTSVSETVPVDVTTGSLRKCMNLYLDWLQSQNAATRAAAGTVGKMRSSTMDCRLFSWDQLRNYESLARAGSMLTINPSTGRPQVQTYKQAGNASEPEWNPSVGDDRFRIQPVLLRYSCVFSYATEKLTAPPDPAKPYALRLFVYPMAVLWNPYNVDLKVPEYCVGGTNFLKFNLTLGQGGSKVVDLTQNNSAVRFGFGPDMGGGDKSLTSGFIIPAGASKVIYPQPVRADFWGAEHRYTKERNVPYEYYLWAQDKKFNLGDTDPNSVFPIVGGVLKNLAGDTQSDSPDNQANLGSQIFGAVGETIKIGVAPTESGYNWSYSFAGTNTDWWGNNGPIKSNSEHSQDALHRFGDSTSLTLRIEAGSPQISSVSPNEIPQRTFGQLDKKPFPLVILDIYRKAADEDMFPSKMGSFSVPGNPYTARTDSTLGNSDKVLPWFESAYSFRLKPINSWFDALKTFQMPSDRDDRVYFGNSYSPTGQLNVIDQEIPLSPLTSLAGLQHLPLFDYRPEFDSTLKTAKVPNGWYNGDVHFHQGRVTQFAQNHAIGNSYASPGIPPEKLSQQGWKVSFNDINFEHLRMDRSYVANAVLWDSWFCSSLGAQDGLLLTQSGAKRTGRQVAEELFKSGTPPPDDAMVARSDRPVDQLLGSLFSANGQPARDAYQKIAEFLRIEGGFNVNSVSEEAWTHFLSGLFSRPHLVMNSLTGREAPTIVTPEEGRFLITRNALANAEPAERASGQEKANRYWNGSREVTSGQIRELASAIVVQVKKRGPFLSLAEFVNRRLERATALSLSGALQTALDDPKVSINEPFRGDVVTGNEGTSAGKPRYTFPEAAKGPKRQGITGYVTQADLLQSLGPFITPRSDTFTIRTMGEAKDAQGKVQARAWCEAVVQRTAKYVDPADDATVADTALKQTVNKQFGRRFEVVSFRWLEPGELKNPS